MTSTAAPTEIDDLKAALAERDSRIKELEHLVDYLLRKPFRPTSEAYAGMAPLFDEAEVEAYLDEAGAGQ